MRNPRVEGAGFAGGLDQRSCRTSSTSINSASPRLSHRERDDGYYAVIVVLDPKCRVIEANDNSSWITQALRGGQWRPTGYFRNRDVMIGRLWPISPEALSVLEALEEWHP